MLSKPGFKTLRGGGGEKLVVRVMQAKLQSILNFVRIIKTAGLKIPIAADSDSPPLPFQGRHLC